MRPPRKSRLEIFLAILESCMKGNHSPYNILKGCRMNYTEAKKFIDFLASRGYLIYGVAKPKTSPTRRKCKFKRMDYFITEKGKLLYHSALPLLILCAEMRNDKNNPLLLLSNTSENK